MNPILLNPTDVLFFRDGRPMAGSLSGHGAAWPLPNVISHAFHAALHRAELAGVHAHRRGRSGHYSSDKDHRDRKFGSLLTAGPFPVCTKGAAHTWFFPRPMDAGSQEATLTTLRPVPASCASSLPAPLQYPVGNAAPPSKEQVAAWWSKDAWNTYLGTVQRDDLAARPCFKSDTDFADTESTYGIGIDPNTGTVEESKFYSASYLRLREGWRLGTLATAPDKDFRNPDGCNDLIFALLGGHGGQILVGGQQRVCSAMLDPTIRKRLPLPLGKSEGFLDSASGRHLVKWVLLTPAIWPQIVADPEKNITAHNGGWLPNWIHPETGEVLLKSGDSARESGERRDVWRTRVRSLHHISSKLVAAITGKPLPVTGWALPNGTDRSEGGAKSTHLAVPAGAVYYFECSNKEAAQALAAALNWHGDTAGAAITNRRSTLMGEKGFGLGVCGTWQFHDSMIRRHPNQ
ncbi:MAG: hypothetical protein NTW21_33075 [Verrucomicrobia bacterium]|nr:hypothetical protein [Verrucomicrobiota bacterium]